MKSVLLLMNILYCLSFNATNVEIPLHCKSGDHPIYGKDKRTLTLEPQAIIDESLLSIYTNVSVSYVQVVIKDSIGSVVYFGYDGTTAKSHTFTVGELPEGSYTLEVLIGDCTYYGEFTN